MIKKPYFSLSVSFCWKTQIAILSEQQTRWQFTGKQRYPERDGKRRGDRQW